MIKNETLQKLFHSTIRAAILVLSIAISARADTIQNGLIGYWAGENNTDDTSPVHNTTVYDGGVTYVNGAVGRAFDFSGVDRIHPGFIVRDIAQYSFGPSLSIGFWILGNSPGTYLGQDSGSGLNEKWFLAVDYPTPGYFDFHINHPSGPISYIGPQHSIPFAHGVWNHLTYVKDGDNFRFYVNGALSGTSNVPGIVMADPFMIGLSFGGVQEPCCGYFGSMDEITLYDRALSDSEVQQLAHIPSASVPEPGSVLFICVGLCGIAIRNLREKRCRA